MKRLFFILAMVVICTSAFAEKHTVQKGESLQSIATKYKITVSQLVEANPGSDNLFYVGLILNIPESKGIPANTISTPTTTLEQTLTQSTDSEQTTNQGNYNENAYVDGAGWGFGMILEYGFLPKAEGVGGGNWTYGFTVGGNYYFTSVGKGLFAGVRIGYNSANYYTYKNKIGSSVTNQLSSNFISIPLCAGYAFSQNDNRFAITPLAGIDINCCVSGNEKAKVYDHGYSETVKNKLKKKTGFDARLGVQLRLWEFNIGASYVIPLDKGNKYYFGDDGYIAVNIGWGF